ncbi:MAG: UDP-N-acetylmuramoyl-L-alanine--D-glutamate ligase [Thiotrichales bacterium]|nr:MAG: UDP-N-acetylmuramoyl-L-alanine--D-glutamate ligase [Thiotrichales bacterium]
MNQKIHKINYLNPLILGLGNTGISCIEFFCRRNINSNVYDTRVAPPNLNLIKNYADHCRLQKHITPQILDNTDVVVISPGVVPEDLGFIGEIKQRNIKIISDIELFATTAMAPIIAVTGTNGKSTVVTLITKALEQAGKKVLLGGNIGTCALELLKQATPDFYVLELSSFQLEFTHNLNALVGVVLNIEEDHLDRHKTFANYQMAKLCLYTQCQYAVINRTMQKTIVELPSVYKSFGLDKADKENFGLIQQNTKTHIAVGDTALLLTSSLKIATSQYIENALATLATISFTNIQLAKCFPAIQEFTGLPHRCQIIQEQHGIKWIDDSKATNIAAAISALCSIGATCNGKIILLAGGLLKNADCTPLIPHIKKYVSKILLFGEDAKKIYAVLEQKIAHDNIEIVGNLTKAVSDANNLAKENDCVLLSPFCASFDMFKDFADRGNVFQKAVQEVLL